MHFRGFWSQRGFCRYPTLLRIMPCFLTQLLVPTYRQNLAANALAQWQHFFLLNCWVTVLSTSLYDGWNSTRMSCSTVTLSNPASVQRCQSPINVCLFVTMSCKNEAVQLFFGPPSDWPCVPHYVGYWSFWLYNYMSVVIAGWVRWRRWFTASIPAFVTALSRRLQPRSALSRLRQDSPCHAAAQLTAVGSVRFHGALHVIVVVVVGGRPTPSVVRRRVDGHADFRRTASQISFVP